MALDLIYQNLITTGLGTTSFILRNSGIYTLGWTISLPITSQDGGVSLAIMTIKQNTLRFYTGPAGGTGSRVVILANAGDQIDCTLASNAAVDKALNAIKTTYSLIQRGNTTNLGGTTGTLVEDFPALRLA